jgi:hypothetical protein
MLIPCLNRPPFSYQFKGKQFDEAFISVKAARVASFKISAEVVNAINVSYEGEMIRRNGFITQ